MNHDDTLTKVVDIDGRKYVYLVETGEIFGEEPSDLAHDSDFEITKADLARRAESVEAPAEQFESRRFGLRTLSISVAGDCNLGCSYCYVFDEETPVPAPARIDPADGRRQIDFLIDAAGDAERVTVTFFGGEPLLNVNAVREIARYGRERADAAGKRIGFTITTNGTLLTDEVVAFLREYDMQVTVSLDGPRAVNDARRPFKDGVSGSYDRIAPDVAKLLDHYSDRRHRVGARATLSRGNADVERVVEHLLGMGFHEVSASVATTADPELAFTDAEYEQFSEGLDRLARRFVDAALAGRYFGFTNVSGLVRRFHDGSVRDYPCGATIGLAGSDSRGDLYVCHRFVGDDRFKIGSIDRGLDHDFRNDFVRSRSVRLKEYCRPCWLRHLCGGGCYHEALLSGGDDFSRLVSVCDRLRRFYESCLRAYLRIADKSPVFLDRFEPQIDRHIHGDPTGTV